MKHLQPFQSRSVLALPVANTKGWHLKRYAILSNGRAFDDAIASSALRAAVELLPIAGDLLSADTNHGVGFQIIHYAEVAVLAPVFYWQWGSVLANVEQMRAAWEQPTEFGTGKDEVVGCVWEMDVVNFEVCAWKGTVLGSAGKPSEQLSKYLEAQYLT